VSAESSSATPRSDAPPGDDELEVTIFGPMLGESIVVHIGSGEWVIIDSCFASAVDETPMALQYLEALDVRIDRDVRLVVATHWHDDHIAGMAKIVRRCRKSKVAVSSAFTGHDFNALVELVEPSMLRRSGVREFWEIWGYFEDARRSPTHASAGKELYFRRTDVPARVWALSPGDRDVWLGLRRFRNFYRKAIGALLSTFRRWIRTTLLWSCG